MGKRYADIGRVLQSLGLQGDESKYGNFTPEQKERSYGTRIAYEIADSIFDAEVDAVEVVRCGKCFWEIDAKGAKGPICACPERPGHPVDHNGYCDRGIPKRGAER